MIVAAHQPNYLPWLGFFNKIANVDRFMLVDGAQFVKRGTFGWIHRNKIRTREGWQWLSLPIQTKGKREQSCAEAELQNEQDWARKHWKAIEYNYRLAPHFTAYSGAFRDIYSREWTHLTPLAAEVIRTLCAAFDITTPIDIASDHAVNGESTGLVIAVCKHYGASRYLSGVHGRDYLDSTALTAANVAIEYQDFAHPVYPQCQPGPFEPGMCALDLLFNMGPEAGELVRRGGLPGSSVAHADPDADGGHA